MGSESWFRFLIDRLPELWVRTGEHVMLAGVSTGVAILIGIPLGILIFRVAWLRSGVLGGVGILQTIPSLAMLVFLLAMLDKIGVLPALIALTLYALLPVVRNTYTGLAGVSSEVIEAARGIGMSNLQRLFIVQIPLAMPVIIAGIRTAAVIGVGIATLSAFIGAGGLGQFINRGLALANTDLILLGAVPAAILAILVDFTIGAAEWSLRPPRHGVHGLKGTALKFFRPAARLLPVILIVGGIAVYSSVGRTSGVQAGTVRIASKNFTEQLILGEMMAQLIEEKSDLGVERRFNLGGTMICHGALVAGEVDLYAEYTGTALTAILERPVVTDPNQAYGIVKTEYSERFDVTWMRPFGFNNTYAVTVRESDAVDYGWSTISDLVPFAKQVRAGFTAEFAERPDGYPGLQDAYRLAFGDVRDLDPGLMYPAIARGEVDAIVAFATDGRIPAYNLRPLDDDLGYFPPYFAAPVVRADVLRAYPQLRSILNLLSGVLDDQTMQQLNFAVDEEKQAAHEVVRDFLVSNGLVRDS